MAPVPPLLDTPLLYDIYWFIDIYFVMYLPIHFLFEFPTYNSSFI